MSRAFTSREVVERTGITPRQLQWWDEEGIVVPARQGHRRLYSPEDLAEVAVICELRERGFSLQKIRRILDLLRTDFRRRLAELVTGGTELHLLTDGESIYLRDSDRGVVDVLRNSRQPLLAVCLSDAVERVAIREGSGQEVISTVPRSTKNEPAVLNTPSPASKAHTPLPANAVHAGQKKASGSARPAAARRQQSKNRGA